MGLNETTKHMRDTLSRVCSDLEKAAAGNKAAAQRVRTGTIKLEKTAKNFRRESINAEKSGTFPKRPSQQKKSSNKASKPQMKASKAKTSSKPAARPNKPQPNKRPANKASARK
ncbi:MAG TPA: histone [Chlamydiales bacterium]|nr:histone [Chlamydiales bacterium]